MKYILYTYIEQGKSCTPTLNKGRIEECHLPGKQIQVQSGEVTENAGYGDVAVRYTTPHKRSALLVVSSLRGGFVDDYYTCNLGQVGGFF